MKDQQQSVSLVVVCLETDRCEVAFEPEGAVHQLARGDAFQVDIEGPSDSGSLEIGYTPDGLMINAWPGAETRVQDRQGRQLPT